MPREDVDDARLGTLFAFALDQKTVYTRLCAVLIVWKGVKAKVEELLAVTLANRGREQVAKQVPAVVRVTEAPEGSHLDSRRRMVPGWN